MAFYDNYSMNRPESTSLGKKIVNHQNIFFINLIRKYLSEKIDLLEIGPGKGDFARECIKNKINYVAIEGSINLYKKLVDEGLKVYCGMVPPIKISGKYNVIFMNQVFEHLDGKKEAQNFLISCRKKLKNKGLLIICSPEISFWKEDFFVGDYTHSNPTSLINVEQIMFDNGFKVLNKGYYTLWFHNTLICIIIAKISRVLYSMGLFSILFGKCSFKMKSVLLPSFYLICEKND